MTLAPTYQRGAVGAQPPGFAPVIISAVEMGNIEPCLAPMNSSGVFWILMYVLTPTRISFFPRNHPIRLDIAAGTGVLMHQHTKYRIDTRPARSGSHHFWMQIDYSDTPTSLLTMIDDATTCARFTDPHGALAARFAAMVEAVQQQRPEPFWVMQAHGGGIIKQLSRAVREPDGTYRIDPADDLPTPDHLVNRAIAFMTKNLAERVRLEDLAEHLHASPSTVSHRYRAATGEAPIQTLNRMRMLQAKRLLVEGSSLRQIADALGFYDEHHFSRAFKKNEGVSPLQFARAAGVNRPMLGPRPGA